MFHADSWILVHTCSYNGMIDLVLNTVNQMVNYRIAESIGCKDAGKETLGLPND